MLKRAKVLLKVGKAKTKKARHHSGIPFPNATIKRFVERHRISKDTRIAREALDRLNRVLDEVGGWIIRESEKLATGAGKKTIDATDIRDAAKLYLSLEEVEHAD